MKERPLRPFRYWMIPWELVSDYDLPPLAWLLWAEIRAMGTKENPCFASNAHFAEHLRITEDHVGRLISELKKTGLVRQVGFDGRTRYLVAFEPRELASVRGSSDQNPESSSRGRPGQNAGADPAKMPGQNDPAYIVKGNLKLKDLPGLLEASPASGSTGEKTPEEKPNPPRPRDHPFEALAQIDKLTLGPTTTKSERGRVNRASKEIRDAMPPLVGETPEQHGLRVADEIRRRAKHYQKLWPDITLTSTALSSNWSKLASLPPDALTRSERAALVRKVADARSDLLTHEMSLCMRFELENIIKETEARLGY